MLNGGTKQLDHILSIGKSDRCGLGYKGESSKAEGVFVSERKAEAIATPATRPKVKVSAKKTSNGKTAVKTATGVKNVTAMHIATYTAAATTSGKVSDLKAAFQRKFRPICHHCGVVGHIRPRCFKLLREKNQMKQIYGMRCHSPTCYSCGVQGHVRRGEVVTFWSKECISHRGEEHGDGRPDVDGAYLMGEKSMVWCTSRGREKHI
ncbi:hypothetical protein Bca101_008652 [Brassica carinata]